MRPDPAAPTAQGLDWPRTLAAKGPAALRQAHLRWRAEPGRLPMLHLIALDTSGSMQRAQRLARAKGLVALLLERAARAGDHAALLSFGAGSVSLLLPAARARAATVTRVRPLGAGGGTPLRAGLQAAERVLRAAARRGPCPVAWLWLLSDGRTPEAPARPHGAQHIVVVDFDDPGCGIGRCAEWARDWGAQYRLASQELCTWPQA